MRSMNWSGRRDIGYGFLYWDSWCQSALCRRKGQRRRATFRGKYFGPWYTLFVCWVQYGAPLFFSSALGLKGIKRLRERDTERKRERERHSEIMLIIKYSFYFFLLQKVVFSTKKQLLNVFYKVLNHMSKQPELIKTSVNPILMKRIDKPSRGVCGNGIHFMEWSCIKVSFRAVRVT